MKMSKSSQLGNEQQIINSNMRNRDNLLLLFFSISEIFINVAYGQTYNNETVKLIGENNPAINYHSRNNLLSLSSVWGCDKYSAAVYVVTERAINFAKDVTIYLESNMNNSLESSRTSSPFPVDKLKLNVLRRGVDFYRDLILVSKVLWHDFRNAFFTLGQQLSNELELRISGIPN